MEARYINESGGSVTLAERAPFFLGKTDGLGNVRNIVSTFKAPSQDGAFFVSDNLDMREITLSGTIVSGGAEETYELRRELIRAFNPKLKGTLIVGDLSIPCTVDEAPVFGDGTARTRTFFVSLLCPSPFFESLNEIRKDLAAWYAMFEFTLEIPEDDGIEFAVREPSLIIEVENLGDVPCGASFEFHALGEVDTPMIINAVTGEYIKLNRVMRSGERIIVSTHFANKKVISNIVDEPNVFPSLDDGSAFLQLEVGSNHFRYDAAEGLDNLEVAVYFRQLYLGV